MTQESTPSISTAQDAALPESKASAVDRAISSVVGGSHAAAISSPPTEQEKRQEAIAAHEPRNLAVLAAHIILLRVGWVFKTESVLIPAFVDAIDGSAWMRGCVPALSRLGQSVPPLFYSQRLRSTVHKKWMLCASMVLMGVTMLAVATMCLVTGGQRHDWVPPLFLCLYGVFASINGISALTYGTVQGKLIQASRRGLLLTVSTVLGVIPASFLAWWVMPGWLRMPDGGYSRLFGTAGFFFVISGFVGLFVWEPADHVNVPRVGLAKYIRGAIATLRRDHNFRRLCVIAMLFGTVQILFPHYQAYGKSHLHLADANLMTWVVVQNIALGVFSLMVGPIADFKGNRLALHFLILSTALTPVLAVVLGHIEPDTGRALYPLVFVLLGLTPVTLKSLVNYTLEICPPIDHPEYLSTMTMCQALPFLFSPLVGLLLDASSFEFVALCGAVAIFTAGLLTFTLAEPRHAGS